MAKLLVHKEENNTGKDTRELLDLRPVGIDSLIARAQAIEDHSTDYLVNNANSSTVRMNESAGLTFTAEDGVHSFDLSSFSLTQLGIKLGVPARYIEKCIRSGRIDLAQDNVNSWLEDYNKDLFIREYGGRIRGILSSRYSVCDTPDILKAIKNSVDTDKYKVKGSYLDEERFHLRMVSNEMLPIEGEDLFAGLFLDSSDVGRSTLILKFGIWKQVCTNGLTICKAGGTLYQQKHIGITPDEFYESIVASLKNINVLANHAVEWITFARQRPNNIGYKKNCTKEEMEQFVERIKTSALIPREASEKVITLMNEKYGNSQWGYVNSLTEVAQDFTLEKRIDIEDYAGRILVA